MTDEPTAEPSAPPGSGRRASALDRPGTAATTEEVRAPQPGTVAHAGSEATTVLRTLPPAAATPDATTGPGGTADGDRVSSGPPPADPGGTADPGATAAPPAAGAGRRRRRWPVVVLSVLLVASLAVGGYLLATARAYAERLDWTEQQARAIGSDLALTRSDLEGARSEIEGLQVQLTTAQERITALADEKAQIGDDREAQRQLLDYQARVSEAAGIVASALDRCVQGQDQLIAYLEDAASYDPADLANYGSEVEALCRSASDANVALQSELDQR
ncbi:COG2 family protein [Cellulomonas aerilata]|uniref:COG2 family protein n=1 Tax=Cellulomonas aerilata TaxID=515326 RepID=UPI001FE6FC81|nr:COG2 family protein [Cellulomonas aerilata]